MAEEFDIRFTNNNTDVYNCGAVIEGIVSFFLDKPLKVNDVTIYFDGRAKNHWTRTEGTGDHRHTVSYNAEHDIVKQKSYLWTRNEEVKYMAAGQYQYPFRFQLPTQCPPSFENSNGYIRYRIFVEIDIPWAFDDKCERYFTVSPAFDLNTIPRLALPVIQNVSEETGFILFRRGDVGLSCRIPKVGYVPGETITCDCTVENDSTKSICLVEAKIIKQIDLIAYRYGSGSANFYNGEHVGCYESKTDKQLVVITEAPLDINPKSKAQFQLELPIPPTVPSFDCCPITRVVYFFKVKIISETSFSNKIKNAFQIVIGTVPFRPTSMEGSQPIYMPHPHAGDSEQTGANPSAPAQQDTPQPSQQPDISEWAPPPTYEEAVSENADNTEAKELRGYRPRYPFYPGMSKSESVDTSNPTEPSAPPE